VTDVSFFPTLTPYFQPRPGFWAATEKSTARCAGFLSVKSREIA